MISRGVFQMRSEWYWSVGVLTRQREVQSDVAAITGIYENAESFWEHRVKNAHKRADTCLHWDICHHLSIEHDSALIWDAACCNHFLRSILLWILYPWYQEEAQELLERAVQKEVIRVVLCSSISDLEKVQAMLSENLMLTKDVLGMSGCITSVGPTLSLKKVPCKLCVWSLSNKS